MAVRHAKQMIRNCHVALLMFDATTGVTRGDMRIAEMIVKEHKSCIFVANKVDCVTDRARASLETRMAEWLPMLKYAPFTEASALRGDGLSEAMDLVVEAARWRTTRVPRRRLNELFKRAQMLRPLPMVRAAMSSQAGRTRILQVAQGRTETPTFVFKITRDVQLHQSQIGWIENTIRSQWAFTGTPLRIVLQPSERRGRRRKGDAGREQAGQSRAMRLAVGRLRSVTRRGAHSTLHDEPSK